MKAKILVCRFPGNFHEDPDTVTWIMKTIREIDKDPRIESQHMFVKSDTPITMVRNEAVKFALDKGVDYCLMIDNDMKPDYPAHGREALPFFKTALDWMWGRDAPTVVASPYVGPNPNNNIYIFRWRNNNNYERNNANIYLSQFTREEAAERSGFEKVAALPTGLVLIDMRIFQRMDPKKTGRPWFDYEWNDAPYNTQKGSTEDVYFTRNASTAWWDVPGAGCWVLWDSWSAHIKRGYCEPPELPWADYLGMLQNDALKYLPGKHVGETIDPRMVPRSNYRMVNIGSDGTDWGDEIGDLQPGQTTPATPDGKLQFVLESDVEDRVIKAALKDGIEIDKSEI